MRVSRWLIPLLLVVAPTGAMAQPRPITLHEAVDLARANAPAVVQARGQQRTSEAAVRSAYAAFLPDLSLTAGAARQSPPGERLIGGQRITTPWAYNTGLTATMDLFQGGQRIFDIRQTRAREAAAGMGLVSQEFTASLDAKQQFFNVLAARESQVAAAAQLDQAEQQRRVSVALARARQATRSDSLRAEIQVRQAQLAVLDAQNTLETANASLTRAVGSDEPVTAGPAPADTTAESLALGDAEITALAERGPLVTQSESLLRAAKAANTASWSDYLPSASLSYSRSGRAGGQVFAFPNDLGYTNTLSLSLSIPIFDRLQREERHVTTDVAEENARASMRDAQLAARQGVVQWLGAYHVAQQKVQAQLATVEAAEEDLRVQQQRYAVGGSTLLDVLTSETQLNQARRDLIQARYDQRVAKAQLEALVGRDL